MPTSRTKRRVRRSPARARTKPNAGSPTARAKPRRTARRRAATSRSQPGRVSAARAKPQRAVAPPSPRVVPATGGECFFASRHTDAFERACTALGERFEVTPETPARVRVRWSPPVEDAVEFWLDRTDRAAMTRRMRAGQRSVLARARPRFDTFLVLSFDDLATVLDEANGLIEAQATIMKAAEAPKFNVWNKQLVSSCGDEVGVFDDL